MSIHRGAWAIGLLAPWQLLCLAAAPLSAAEIIGAKSSKVYHTRPDDCSMAGKITPENRIAWTTEKEAQAEGRRLCKRCEQLEEKEAGRNKADADDKSKPTRPGGPTDPPNQGGAPPSADADGPLPDYARVKSVLPGGTLELDTGEKAALIGVVCPGEAQPMSKETIRFIEEQTRGRTVRLSYDRSACSTGPRDDWGRLGVYLTPEPDGRDLGGELIFQGYAWLDRRASFDHRAEYLRNEEDAWRAQRGIWSRSAGPGDTKEVFTGRYVHEYHRPGCRHLRHMVGLTKMSLNEAKARRLTPCPDYRAGDKSK